MARRNGYDNLSDELKRVIANRQDDISRQNSEWGSSGTYSSDTYSSDSLSSFKNKNTKKKDDGLDEESRRVFNLIGRGLWLGTLSLFLLFCFFAGHYTLTEEQEAVVFTFGKPSVVTKAGWNWKIPFVQEVKKVSKSIMGLTIGYDEETNESIENESLMITKDFNFVNVDFYIEYRVSDPIKAVVHQDTYKSLIKMLAQSYIRDTIGVHLVDEVLTTGKAEIQSEIETQLKERVTKEDFGYSIERVLIQDGELPTVEVRQAFKRVEDAKQSMETALNNANKYRSEKIPQMEAEVDNIIKQAEVYKQNRINDANAQVARFDALYKEYEKAPYVTKRRMFYEAMEEVMPDIKVIIDSNGSTQTMLPLEKFSETITTEPAKAED